MRERRRCERFSGIFRPFRARSSNEAYPALRTCEGITKLFGVGAFPSSQRRGGCGINKKSRSHRSAADGVVSLAKCSGLKISPNFLLRLRPLLRLRAIALALRVGLALR